MRDTQKTHTKNTHTITLTHTHTHKSKINTFTLRLGSVRDTKLRQKKSNLSYSIIIITVLM